MAFCHIKRFRYFEAQLQKLDTSQIADVYSYLDGTDLDRKFMIECILVWVKENEELFDDAVEYLGKVKKSKGD